MSQSFSIFNLQSAIRKGLLAFSLLVFVGCSPSSQSPGSTSKTILFVDDVGREVQLPARIDRIVPLAPNITEILYAAGAGSHVVAVSQADDYPPDVESLPRFSSFPLDYEALLSYAPEVVIGTNEVNNPRDAHLMESLGMPVIYFSFDGWADVLDAIRQTGKLAGSTTQADAVVDSLDALMDGIANTFDSIETKPSVLFLIGSDQLFSFGAGSYIHDIIAVAGGESLTAEIENRSPILSEEFVLTARPDVIIGTFDKPETLLERHSVFENVPAIAEDRVCIVEPSLVLRPGPRLVDGVLALASCIHPDISPQ